MAQILSLTTPIPGVTPPTVTGYEVIRFLIERKPVARISIVLDDNTGNRILAEYSDANGGTTAATLISALNTANLSVKSLQQRILERLAADGKIPAGTVTGTPD